MILNRTAGNSRTLIGRSTGIAQNDFNLLKLHVKLFSHDLSKRGLKSGAKINVTMQGDHSAVCPQRQHDFNALGRVTRHRCRLAWRRWIGRRRITHHQQYVGRI